MLSARGLPLYESRIRPYPVAMAITAIQNLEVNPAHLIILEVFDKAPVQYKGNSKAKAKVSKTRDNAIFYCHIEKTEFHRQAGFERGRLSFENMVRTSHLSHSPGADSIFLLY